jgi:tetratricopeptide (TPR) repeat protein
LTSNWPKNREAWALWAEVLLNQADAGKALDVALRGLVYNPNDRALLLLKAKAEGTRSPVLAIQTLKGLREIDPNDTNVLLALANAYTNSGEPDKAVALLQNQVSIGSPADRLRCQTTLVVALYQKGDKAGAETLLAQLAQSSPNEPAILSTQVRLLSMEQRWDDLMARMKEWIVRHPEDLATPMTIAMDLNSLTDPSAQRLAEQILRDLLSSKPDSLKILGVLSQILHKAGRVPETVEVYRKMVDLDRQNVIAMNNLAWILCEEMGNGQEALVIANRGLEVAPDYLDLLDTRGVAYYRLGRFDRAVEDLSRCVRLYPEGAQAGVGSRFHLARAYAKLNRKEDAIKFLNEAMEIQSRIGGLSPQDLTEARQLLDDLQR